MSAILSADDLNDFISPGVACIKPVEDLGGHDNSQRGEVEIQVDQNGQPLEVSKLKGSVSKLNPAQISLADCLACSGCITSADEVLVAEHSHEELLRAIRENNESDTPKVFVASVSLQSRASLAHAYGYPVDKMDILLLNLLMKQMKFRYVVGTGLGRKLSLINEAQNIIRRKESNGPGPTLSSICPGWVLYAEKTHPYVLLRMSDIKSPQQITGCLLKNIVAHELGITPQDVYHLSIMPCFDKKLESARPEQGDESGKFKDVDCVLTAKELVKLVEDNSNEFSLEPNSVQEILARTGILASELYREAAPQSWPYVDLSWSNDSGSASGGYAVHYIQYMKEHLIQTNNSIYYPDDFRVEHAIGRNSDIYELRLLHKDKVVANAAVVNGFRNIQNLVRKLKPSTNTGPKTNPLVARRRARKINSDSLEPKQSVDASQCDYVEIMACPNGCINGGGQISAPSDISEKEWLQNTLNSYNSVESADLWLLGQLQEVFYNLQNWCFDFCKEFGITQKRLLRTWFKEVETKNLDPNAILLGSKW